MPTTFFVEETGSDAADGLGPDRAFATLTRAAGAMAPGDTCLVGPGVYREELRPPSGEQGRPVTFRAVLPGAAVIAGADPVVGPWTLASVDDLPPGQRGAGGFERAVAGGSVWKARADLPLGVDGNQVFVDGRMVFEARWPDTGPNPLTPSRAIAGPGTSNRRIEDADLDQPDGFWVGANAHVTGGFEWESHTAAVVASGRGWVEIDSPFDPSTRPGRNRCAKPGNRYYLMGSLGALDAPGEWFYDEQRRLLFVWPPGGSSGTRRVEAKQRLVAFDLRGRSHVRIEGFQVFAASIVTDESSRGNVIAGIEARYVSHFNRIGRGEDRVEPRSGIVLRGEGNELTDSAVTFSAANGVLVQGRRNRVVNCVISEVNYLGVWAAGVMVQNASNAAPGCEATVSHNTIFDCGFGGIILTTEFANFPPRFRAQQGNRVSYNDVFNVMAFQQDFGCIEGCNYLDMTGTEIDHNWTHDNLAKTDRHRVGAAGGAGIYLDLGSGNAAIHHNVSWSNGMDALRLNGDGKESAGNRVYNNTLGPGNHWAVGSYIAPSMRGTLVANNILCGTSQVRDDAEQLANLAEPEGPLFVDASNGDFRLLPTAPAVGAGKAIPEIADAATGAPDVGALPFGDRPWRPGSSLARLVTVDDAETGHANVVVRYLGRGWSHLAGEEHDPGDATVHGGAYGAMRAYPYRGTFSRSDATGDAVEVSFHGRGVLVHVVTGPDAGFAAVTLDDDPEQVVDTFSEAMAGDQLVWGMRDLRPGRHVVTIVVTGSGNRLSTGSFVCFDRVDVVG